jgi:3-dehydro-L-gulonate 2-dehydrogenase
MPRVPFDVAQRVVTEALVRVGMHASDASVCATVHTASSCDGVYSHGLNRVARFVEYIRRGWVDPDGKAALVKALGSIEVWDGHFGPGIINAIAAVDRAMALSALHGVGIVGLRNTTHWMRGGTYGWRAADRGYLAICWTNTEACMPAWGGQNVRIGNNPFVMAVPRARGHLVLDMAMSQYSYGKLQVARLKGESLPFPGGFDQHGQLTSEPGLIEQSMRILPMGYWKGSGFAMLLDVLAAVLSDGRTTNAIDRVERGSGGGSSQVFIAIDPAKLGGQPFIDEVADSVVDYVASSVPAENGRDVRYPGEGQLRTRADHLEHGIVVDDSVWQGLVALAGEPQGC